MALGSINTLLSHFKGQLQSTKFPKSEISWYEIEGNGNMSYYSEFKSYFFVEFSSQILNISTLWLLPEKT